MTERKFSNPLYLDTASSPRAEGDPVVKSKDIENRNGLAENQFIFTIDKLKNLNYMVTSCNIPGLNLGEAIFATPTTDVKTPGDKLVFEPLIVRYKVDERLENFLELQRWIRGLAFSSSHLEFERLQKGWHNRVLLDASISIPTNDLAFEMIRVHYKNCFPTAMEGIEFNSEGGEMQITATVTFSYSDYDIYVIPEGEDIGSEKLVI